MAGFVPDWSLQRKGATDQRRHLEKVKQALKERLPDLVSDEAIVASDGKHVIRVPIRSLEQYKFRFHPWQGDRVGQDQGQGQPGDVLGKLPRRGQEAGQGDKPGETPGIDYIEAEVTIDDIQGLLFDELGLPYLKPKPQATIPQPTWKFKDISPKGLMGNLDKRRSLRQNLLRNARETGKARVGGWHDDDLRFKTWVDEPNPEDNAVIIAMRDISGSMGDFKKMMARTFSFWMLKFLRTQYRAVEVVFLVHHTQAREVTEEEFFQLGESGGTKVSSVYQLCREVIETRYPPGRWNIYPIHFSDGDNWSDADNRRTVEVLETLLPAVNVFGYGEIREGGYTSTLMAAFKSIKHPRFKMVTMTQRQDVYPALKTFFPRHRKEG